MKGLERYEGAPVDAIRQATRQALTRLVDLALEERVDFVLIAGDLYDGDWPDHNTGLRFVDEIRRLRQAGIPLYVIAGNHDAASRLTRHLPLPKNPGGDELFLSSRRAETRRLESLGVAIHGRSFQHQAETGNLAAEYPPAEPGLFNIGLLHTSLEGDVEHDPYAPCSLADLRSKNYQYWALGHIHKRRVVCEDPWVVYPGNIQGRHIRETGARGCLLVSVGDNGRVTCDFRPLDVFRWEVVRVDCTGVAEPDAVRDRARRALHAVLQQHDLMPVGVRVILEGTTTLHQKLSAAARQWTADLRAVALSEMEQVWIEKVQVATSLPAAAGSYAESDAAASELTAYLSELQRDEGALQELLSSLQPLESKLPPELKSGPEALRLTDADWVRRTLSDVGALLLERLKPPEAG